MSAFISIIIPAFNEARRITPTILALDDVMNARGAPYEILVVDDGSRDATLGLCRALKGRVPALTVIPGAINRGKGHAVRVGMLAARGDVRVMVDADGSTPAHCLDALLQPLLDGVAEVCLGSRYVAGSNVALAQPWWRRAWSRGANLVNQSLLLPGIRDTHCGFKAFTASAARWIFPRTVINGWSADLEVLTLACHQRMRVCEIPVAWSDDARSRVRPMSALIHSILELAAIRLRLGRPPAPQFSTRHGGSCALRQPPGLQQAHEPPTMATCG